MQIIIDMCSVSYQVTIEYRFKSSPHKSPINNHPTYECNVSKFGFPSWTAPAAEKTLGFPTDDSIGKLLLRRMTSDY